MAQQCATVCLNYVCVGFGYILVEILNTYNEQNTSTYTHMLDMKHICIVFGETFCINHVPNRCYQ